MKQSRGNSEMPERRQTNLRWLWVLGFCREICTLRQQQPCSHYLSSQFSREEAGAQSVPPPSTSHSISMDLKETLLCRPGLCGKHSRVWLLIVPCLLCCRSGTITSMERLTAAAVSCCSKCMNCRHSNWGGGHSLPFLGVLCRATSWPAWSLGLLSSSRCSLILKNLRKAGLENLPWRE